MSQSVELKTFTFQMTQQEIVNDNVIWKLSVTYFKCYSFELSTERHSKLNQHHHLII